MPAAEDLSAFYDVTNGDAEHITLAATPRVAAIFSSSTQVAVGEALVQAPTLRLPAAVASSAGAAPDAVCIVRGASYIVRQVMDLPPDGAEQLLVLSKA